MSCGHSDHRSKIRRTVNEIRKRRPINGWSDERNVNDNRQSNASRSPRIRAVGGDWRRRPLGPAGMVLHADGRRGDLRRLLFCASAIAALVPIAILAISDLLLPAYDSFGVMIATYAVMIVPVLFGRWLQPAQARWSARCCALGDVRTRAGDAVFDRIELRRLGISERLREVAGRPDAIAIGRPCRSTAGCSPATCSIWPCCSAVRRWPA